MRVGHESAYSRVRIHLDATHDAALKGGDVTLKDLQEFAVEK